MSMSTSMRRVVVAVTTGLMVALIGISLYTLATAGGDDEGRILPSAFASPIDPPSTIAGTVFADVDGDGGQDPGEQGISGVRVRLGGHITNTLPVDITNPDGEYAFEMTWSGDYTVTAMTPAGYTSTTPESQVAHVPGPGMVVGVDFGYRIVTHLPLVSRDYP